MGAIPPALEERAARGAAGFLDQQISTPPPGPPPATPAALATEGLPPAIEMPEIVAFAHELMEGKYPQIFKRLRSGARGDFSPRTGNIRLSSEIFQDAAGAARTLAHELGHMSDWLPEETMARGNILGRIGSLKSYMKSMIEAMPDQAGKILTDNERAKIRNEVVNSLIKKAGGTMQQYIKDKPFRKSVDAQVSEMYKRRIQAEVVRRGLITKDVVMDELKKLTQIWKPFDPAADAEFTAYRHSSPELYADAVSVLFNNPALLRQVSPTFYKSWFSYLDRKPVVRDAYMGIIDEIRGGKVQESRQDRVRGMFQAGERQAAAERIASEPRPRQIIRDLRREMIDKNEGILRYIREAKRKGEVIRPEDNPQYLLESMNYSASEVKAWLSNYDKMIQGLDSAGVTWEDLGDVLFHQRVIGERGEFANPQGFTPSTSGAQLEFLRKQLGEEKWAVLMKATDAYRDAWKFVVDKLEKSGMLSQALMDKIRANPYYATFDVFVKHSDEMAGGGSGAGAKIYGQVGTLQQISNPATATLMKGVALIKAVNRNDAARVTAEFLSEHTNPDVIRPAEEKWNGFARAPVENVPDGKGILKYLDAGSVKGFVVDSEISKAFERNDDMNPFVNILRKSQVFFREIFVQKNPGFMAFNLYRDFFRTYKNLPKAGMADVVSHYVKSLSPAFRRAFDIPDPLVNEMLQKKMLITMEERWGLSTEDEQVRALMDRYFTGKSGEDLTAIQKASKWLGDIGSAIEAMPKLAGYQYLRDHQKELGLSDQQIAHMIRGQIGSPDFLRRGGSYGMLNSVFMFSNAIKEGWRSDFRVMRDRPGEYAWKTAKANMVPKLLMFAAAAGMMGGGMKEIMDRVSEYDKTNYLIIPFGLTENGKAVYIRVPQDESSRFLMGTMWKILNMNKQQNFADLFDYFAGQAPTLNPALTMGVETLRYMAGQNPYDYFRQRNVVPEQVFEAGGARSDKAFLKHLWNSAGLGIVYRFPTDDLEKAKSTAEKVIGAPILSNLLGRFVKITNYGKFEELQRIAKGVRQGIARRNLDERDAIVANVNATEKPSVENAFKLYGDMVKAGMLKRKGGLSVVSFSEFRKNYEKFSRRKESDPFVNALIFARGNEERSALLNYYRESMSKEDYEQLIADAVSSGAMTMEPLILSFFEEDKKNAR